MKNNIQRIGLDCCGCGNCYLKCPKHAIKMIEDDEGFNYPIVSGECIDCGGCLKTCPQSNSNCFFETSQSFKRESYIALSKNEEIKLNSTSGGVFGTIASSFIEQDNAYVCASMFIDNSLKFVVTKEKNSIRKFQGSKYVQSEIGRVFIKIKELLISPSNKVLFCGTPCQVR